MANSEKKDIVIIGGGVIGSCSAYFLTRHPSFNPALHKITIIEASKIAAGASGKAGGLLARWAYPSSIVPLSYNLHAALAKEHDGATKWGYRGLNCGELEVKGRLPSASSTTSPSPASKTKGKAGSGSNVPKELDWISSSASPLYTKMGDPSNTAQVHPYLFTTSMATLACAAGASIIYGSVRSINRSANCVNSVTYTPKDSSQGAATTTTTIPASTVILAAGPWSRTVYDPTPVGALRAHSVVIRPSKPISPHVLFTEIQLPANFSGRGFKKATVAPEIYPRPDGTAYACGEGDTFVPLPPKVEDVEVDDKRCEDILLHVGSISDELRDGVVEARQACYLPHVTDGVKGPLIGEASVRGLIVACGHTCWGIQNGPGTGKLVSEFVFDGKALSADVTDLNPQKCM